MKVNGQQIELKNSISVYDFLVEQNYNVDRVAIELNGEIISKTKFQSTTLKDSDEVEIVCFVGGGWFMNVFLNGKKVEISEKTLFSAFPKKENNVTILNGFQTSDDTELNENDEIYIIEKGVMPPKEELEAMMSARHTPKVHEILKKSSVAIAGLGGLGSNIAVSLARIGVGKLFLVDFDIVEPSNLNRQSYYVRHLGMLKTEAMKEQLKEINPFIDVETMNVKITEDNVVSIFKGFDVVCEAFDNPVSKAILVNELMINSPKTKIVSGSGMAGYESSNTIKTERKMKNLYLCGDYVTGASFGMGLMAPRVMVCAGHQANMILRLLLGIEDV